MTTIRAVRYAPALLLLLLIAACAASFGITTTSLPDGIVGEPYSQQLQGDNVASWSVDATTLPPGITLSESGLLSGTPTTAGSFTFTVQAAESTASTSPTASRSLTLTVTSPS